MNHFDIIIRAGGTAKIARALSLPYDTIAQWKRNNSIPAPYWAAIAATEIATLEELAEAAAQKNNQEAANA